MLLEMLMTAASAAVGAVHLVERRGRHEKLEPHRHVELATLLHSLPEAALLFDERGRLVEVNSAAEEMYRCSRHDLLRAGESLLHNRQESAPGAPIEFPVNIVEAALRGETVRQSRRKLRTGEQERHIDALVSASPVRGATNSVVGAVVILRDITELGELQQRLADTERHRAIGQMAASIAHDFNNVLESVTQAVFLLEMNAEAPAEERRTYTRMIERSVKRGAEISERIKQYLRSGGGELQEVWLKSTLEDVVELTRPMWSRARNVEVHTELHDPPAVKGNLADLRRVFTNLVINALEAMPEGGCLFIRCEAREHGARVSISDTGMGIAPKDQRKIFAAYFTTKKDGTGLGLSGAQKIVNASGGKISFTSEVGKGTTFFVDLAYAR